MDTKVTPRIPRRKRCVPCVPDVFFYDQLTQIHYGQVSLPLYSSGIDGLWQL